MKKEQWLRISYWSAAIADFVIAARELIPRFLGIEEYCYQAGIVGAVGISWGVLLILADREPMTRKWILKPTILVIFLITVVYIHAAATQLVPLFLGIPSSIIGICMAIISLYALKVSQR